MTKVPGRQGGLRATPVALVALVALGAGTGCGDRGGGPGEETRFGRRADDYRARAERYESDGDPGAALQAYRDAARRFPTQAWPWSGAGRNAAALGRFRQAGEAFSTAIRWDSTLVEDRLALADIALADGRAAEALTLVDDAVRLGGETPARIALRARALADAGRLAEARNNADRALQRAPDDPDIRIVHALCLLRAGATDSALAELDRSATAHAEHAGTYAARARMRRELEDREGALSDLRRALEIAPRSARERLDAARWTLEAGDVATATEDFTKILRDNPNHPAALEGLGSCALASGDPEAAEEAFRRAIEADPELAPAYLALGRFRREEGRLDEAVALFRKARARASREPRLWERCGGELAEAYLALGEPRNAIDVADALLARDSRSELGRALRGKALAAGARGAGSGDALERIATRPQATRDEILAFSGWLLHRGDARRALEFAEQALAGSPGDPDARVQRAEALGALGRTEEAERDLHELLSEGHGTAPTHLALARLYLMTNRLPDALHHSLEGEKLDPEDPDFSVIRGMASLQEGRLQEARAAFERERALRPDSPKPWMNLGRLEMAAGNPDEAAKHFTRAQTLDPDGWLPSYHLGQALEAAGNALDAVDAYHAVLARNERVAEAHNNLAWLLADLDLDPVLAEVHARRAAELAPGNASILGTLGWAQYKNRLLDEAVVSLKEASRLSPDDPMKRYMLGVVEADRGRPESARTEIREALRLDPAFARSDNARRLLADLDD